MHVVMMLAAAIALSVSGRSSANPSIASEGDAVAIAWAASTADGATDIYAAVSRDGGRTFGPAVRVSDDGGETRAGGEQPPRIVMRSVAPSGRLEIVVGWVSRREGTTIRLARSIDGGRTFGTSHSASTPGAPGNRGWH